jgi:hypothetical protein
LDDRRKWLLFGGLLAVWVVLVMLRLLTPPEEKHVPLRFKSGQRTVATTAVDSAGVPKVVRPKQPKPVEKLVLRPTNIFAPLGIEREELPKVRIVKAAKGTPSGPRAVVTSEMFGPERPPPAVAPPAPPQPSPEELAAQQARQQREAATQQARQRLGQYRFLGYLTEGGEHRAFIGKGRELYIVRTGETMEGRIRVGGIEPSGVKLTDADTGVGTTLPLVKESGGPS